MTPHTSIRISLFLLVAFLFSGVDESSAATITIVNADSAGEGFNSTTPRAPEGGNTGTTLGQQRLNVFNRAAQIWGAKLTSTQSIKVESKFDPLTPCSTSGGVLGSAGPLSVDRDFAAGGGNPAPKANTWYPVALAEAISASNRNGTSNEIGATFNSSVDNACLGAGTGWWYGTDPAIAVPSNKIALLPVLLHELAHGLGFLTLACVASSAECSPDPVGALFNGVPDIWTHFMRDKSTNLLWKDMTNTQRASSMVNDPNLVWDGTNVTAAIPTFLPTNAGVNGSGTAARVRLYAPSSVQSGSSGSHWTTATSPNLLMEPAINDNLFESTDLTDALFKDIGWVVGGSSGGNQAPTSTVPTSIAVVEDTLTNLTGISFADADAGSANVLVTFSIPTASGALSNTTCASVGFGTPNDQTRTLTGSITSINSCIAAGAVRYQPALNATATVGLTVSINDQGNTGSGGALITTKTSNLTIGAVNDGPTVSVTASPSVPEDSLGSAITGVTLSDVDAATGSVVLTVSINNGGGQLTWNSGCSTSPGGTQTALTISGTLANIQTCLNSGSLSYRPPLNATGNVTLNFSLNDNGNTGTGGAKSANANMTVGITAQNDAPTITTAATYSVPEDSASASITGMTLADIDAGNASVTTTFTVTSGLLTWSPVCAETFPGGTQTALQITGAITAIQTCLASGSLKFSPVINNTNDVILGIQVNDNGNTGTGGAKSASANAVIQIAAQNDPPTLTAASTLTINEDMPTVLTGLAIGDIDAGSGNVVLSIATSSGLLVWTPVCAGTTPGGSQTNLTVTGTLSALQACLNSSIQFNPASQSIAPVNLAFTLNDQGNTGVGGALSTSANSTINITAVNDAPLITAPSSSNANIESPTALAGISLSDVDAAQGTGSWSLTVSSQSGNGIFNLARDGALAPSCNSTDVQLPNGNNLASLLITGSLTTINACLSQNALTFTPPLNPPNIEVVNLSLNDNGNFGSGPNQNDTHSITLNIVNLFGDGFE